jgi:GTPase SAR1 family protein
MGFGRATAVPEYVGTILSRRQCYSVSKTQETVDNGTSYVVDAADAERIPESKEELFELLDRPVLAGIPLLVLGNKNDLPEAITVEKLIDEMLPPLRRGADGKGPEKGRRTGSFLLFHLGKGKYEFGRGV